MSRTPRSLRPQAARGARPSKYEGRLLRRAEAPPFRSFEENGPMWREPRVNPDFSSWSEENGLAGIENRVKIRGAWISGGDNPVGGYRFL